MSRRAVLGPTIFCGLLLLVILAVSLASNTKPIGFLKNALFETKAPKTVLKVDGKLYWAGDDYYYNFHGGHVKKILPNGKVIWDLKLQSDPLWMGPEGVIVLQDKILTILDKDGAEVFQKSDLQDKIRVLSVKGDYLLLSGKLHGEEYGILLSNTGNIMWQLPFKGSIISGSVHPKGIYTALNIIDDKARARLVAINATGEIIIDNTYSEPIYQIEAISQGIGVIAGDRVFLMSYDGGLLWEHKFKGQVLRGDIGSDGFTSVVVQENMGNLSQEERLQLIMISDAGRQVCSFSLDSRVNQVEKCGDFIYILDDYGVMVLSEDGLLVSNIKQKDIKELHLTDKNYIIAIYEEESLLFQSSHGGN